MVVVSGEAETGDTWERPPPRPLRSASSPAASTRSSTPPHTHSPPLPDTHTRAARAPSPPTRALPWASRCCPPSPAAPRWALAAASAWPTTAPTCPALVRAWAAGSAARGLARLRVGSGPGCAGLLAEAGPASSPPPHVQAPTTRSGLRKLAGEPAGGLGRWAATAGGLPASASCRVRAGWRGAMVAGDLDDLQDASGAVVYIT